MLKFVNGYKGLPKGLYIICVSTLINRLGDFVVPFLSLYLTQKIGMSAWASGVIVTLCSVIGIPAAFIGGRIADMYGRKKILLLAQSLSALALIPCALTENAAITIVCLLISTFFNGFIRPVFSSMITDMLSQEQRPAGFSLNYLAINLGVSIGPIIAGFLFNNLLPLLFLGDALTSLIAVFFIWKNVKETYHTGREIEIVDKAEEAEKGNILQLFCKRPYLLLFILLNIIYSFTYTQHRFSLPVTLNEIFNDQGAVLFGYLMSINAFAVLILTALITMVTKKNNQLTNMVLAGILYAIGFGMLGFANSFVVFIISTVIWTVGEILTTISSGVFIANNSPCNYRARLNAVTTIGYAVGAAISTSFSGIYIDNQGVRGIWYIVFLVSAVASIGMFSLRKYMERTGCPELE
jgi:MFS family permease